MRAEDRGDDVDEPRELPLTLCQRPLHLVRVRGRGRVRVRVRVRVRGKGKGQG